VEELIALFANNNMLKPLYAAAIETERIGAERFENNFRRLLKLYSKDLERDARSALQKQAAILIRSRARYVASAIRKEYEPGRTTRTEQMEQLRHQIPEKSAQLNRYLQEKYQASELAKEDRKRRGIQTTEPGSHVDPESNSQIDYPEVNQPSSEDDDLENPVECYLPTLMHVKEFMVSSNAFEELRRRLEHFVHHPQKVKSKDEVQNNRWNGICIVWRRLRNAITSATEDLGIWETPLAPGKQRVRWKCVCDSLKPLIASY